MNFTKMLNVQGSLFLIMLMGMYLIRAKIVEPRARKALSELVINFTVPAMVIRSFLTEFDENTLKNCLNIIIIALVIQAGTFLLAKVLYLHVPASRRGIMQYGTMASNAGSLGNAVCEGVFGDLGVLYASIYIIPQRTLMWSLGLRYFTDDEKTDRKALIKKVLTHPCILAVILGISIAIFHIPVPEVLQKTIGHVANSNTMLSMLVVGMILGEADLRTLVERDVLYYSSIRLVLIPLLVYIVCMVFSVDALATQVSVVLAAMPAPSVSPSLASKYNKDEVFAAKCVVFSTLLSMMTVPLWCLFLLR